MKRARVPFLFFALVGASALEGCGRSLDIGDVARPDGSAPASDEAPEGTVKPVLPEPVPGPATYAWQWANPQSTGVDLRASFSLPSGETWTVGDAGTVLRDVSGVTTVMRVGNNVEVLSAVWGRGPDDVWVGGARGAGGILIHWNGKAWSDSYPIANLHPIDALQGLSNGNLVVLGPGVAIMDPAGQIVGSCAGVAGVGVRDVWVQSDDEVWFAGAAGITRFTPSTQTCERIDTRNTYGLWGDGATRIVALSQSESVDYVELRERTDAGFVRLGARLRGEQRDVRGGKVVMGDASGRLRAILHSRSGPIAFGPNDSYATYDPLTGVVTVTPTSVGGRGPLDGEVLYGLAKNGEQTTFVGRRGLRGRFNGDTALPIGFRRALRQGMPSPDGATFALCTNDGESTTTSVCKWDAASGWSELSKIEQFHADAGVATSATSLLLGGWTPSPSPTPETYGTRLWNGSTWGEVPQATNSLFTPVFATSPNDVWALSDWHSSSGYKTVHYDGHAWTTQATKKMMIDGLAPNDVWLLDPSELHHWDGKTLTTVASLPSSYTARYPTSDLRGLVAVGGGVWTIGVREGSQADKLLHYNGNDWTIVELPGIAVRSLARGPDGRVRMLSKHDSESAVYVVEDSGISKEFAPPEGVHLNDIFSVGADLYAVGESGATLRLVKGAEQGTH